MGVVPPGDDDELEPPGIGRALTIGVLCVVAGVVLAAAWSLHAFPWQTAL